MTETQLLSDNDCPADWICPKTPVYTSSIGAWYEPWWSLGLYNMWPNTSRYSPTISLPGFGYDSGDRATIINEFANIKAAGIDYLILDDTNTIIDASGIGTKTWIQSNISTMFEVDAHLPKDQKIPMAVAIGGQLMLNRINPLEMQNREADYVLSHFAAWDSVYFKWEGKPLLVNYNQFSTGAAAYPYWYDKRFSVRNAADFVNHAHYAYGHTSVAEHGWWGWVQDFPQPLHAEAMTVSPGGDNAHRNLLPAGCGGGVCDFHLDRQNGQLYIREWLRAIKHNPATIVVASWNEFSDETAIESARPNRADAPIWQDAYGTETPDWYVQITKAYANLRKGLMSGAYYQDEKGGSIYLVKNSKLLCQNAPPHGHPVILLPYGLLAVLNAPACTVPETKSASSLVASFVSGFAGFPHCFTGSTSNPIQQNTYIYKTVFDPALKRNIRLRAHVHYPPGYDYSSGRRLPAVAMFHGGGWAQGNPVYWFPPALYFASRGAITISFQYRLTGWSSDITPAEAAKDGISAIRWMRKYADALGIDPNHIATIGDSAGGHVALSATMLARSLGDESGSDANISTSVSMAIGLYPLTNTSVPFTKDQVHFFVSPSALSYSPLAHIPDFSATDLPLVHILQGTADTFYMTSHAGAHSKDFCNAANLLRTGSCSVSYFENEEHGFLSSSSGVTPRAYADIEQHLIGVGVLSYATPSDSLQWAQNVASVCRTDAMFTNGNLIMNWPQSFGYAAGTNNSYVISPASDAW